MTLGQLRNELTESELVHFAAYYELKGEREERELEKAKNRR